MINQDEQKEENQILIKNIMKGIKAVIFDLDGTLVDSMWMWKQIDIDYLARYGVRYEDELQSIIEGMSFSQTAVYFKSHYPIPDPIEKIKADWNAMAEDFYRTKVPLKPGAEDFLRFLKKKGIKTGIATSNSRELLELILQTLDITKYFTSVHTSCEVKQGKPEPDIYLHVAKVLQVLPEECLVFEDIMPGIQAGKRAGMRVCAVGDDYSLMNETEKRSMADYFIEDFSRIIYEQ